MDDDIESPEKCPSSSTSHTERPLSENEALNFEQLVEFFSKKAEQYRDGHVWIRCEESDSNKFSSDPESSEETGPNVGPSPNSENVECRTRFVPIVGRAGDDRTESLDMDIDKDGEDEIREGMYKSDTCLDLRGLRDGSSRLEHSGDEGRESHRHLLVSLDVDVEVQDNGGDGSLMAVERRDSPHPSTFRRFEVEASDDMSDAEVVRILDLENTYDDAAAQVWPSPASLPDERFLNDFGISLHVLSREILKFMASMREENGMQELKPSQSLQKQADEHAKTCYERRRCLGYSGRGSCLSKCIDLSQIPVPVVIEEAVRLVEEIDAWKIMVLDDRHDWVAVSACGEWAALYVSPVFSRFST